MSDIADIRIIGPSPDITAGALSVLGVETFVEAFGSLYAEADLQKFLRDKHGPQIYQDVLDDAAFGVWVAVAGSGEAVGYLVAGPCDLPVDNMPENSGELMRFYILKPYQGGGLGRRMLEIALDWLKANFDHIYLSVYAENYGAQRLYARHGFEKVQDYFFMVGDHADPEYIYKRVRGRRSDQ